MGRTRKYVAGIPVLCSLLVLGHSIWNGLGNPSMSLRHPETRITREEKGSNKNKLLRKLQQFEDKPHSIEVMIEHDAYASDIFWSLTDSKGLVVAFRNSTEKDDVQPVSTVIPVTAGAYTLEIFDSYGDGLCCIDPKTDGHYKLSVNGHTLAVGGEFADTTGPIRFTVQDTLDLAKSAKDGQTQVTTDEMCMGNGTNLGLQPYCLVDNPKKFDICLYLSTKERGFNNDWLQAFSAAKNKWETIIVGDSHSAVDIGGGNGNHGWQKPDMLDDIYITGNADYIDGPFKVLGSSGPRTMLTIGKINPVTGHYFRQALTGEMMFDTADISRMMRGKTYEDVIVHEMGHVLGIGTMWYYNGLHSGKDSDPKYKGLNAQREYKKIGFPGELEVEIHHGEGTAGGHWDEECLRTEVMTGMADNDMECSTITVGGMEDLGYIVNYSAADPFKVPENSNCGQTDLLNPDAPGKFTSEDSRVRQLSGRKRRRLSDEGRQEAVSYGQSLIAKYLEEKKRVKLAKNEVFIAHQVRHVLYEEEGHIYSVRVSGSVEKAGTHVAKLQKQQEINAATAANGKVGKRDGKVRDGKVRDGKAEIRDGKVKKYQFRK